MKPLRAIVVFILLINSSLIFSMEYKSSAKDNSISVNPVSPVGPVGPIDPVGPVGPTDSGPVNPKGDIDSIDVGVNVDFDKDSIRNDEIDFNEYADDKKPGVSNSVLLFSLRHVKPDGTGKCKFGNITGAWEKSPCSKIYGATPIVKKSTGSPGVTTTTGIKNWATVNANLEMASKAPASGIQAEVSPAPDATTSEFKPSYLDRVD